MRTSQVTAAPGIAEPAPEASQTAPCPAGKAGERLGHLDAPLVAKPCIEPVAFIDRHLPILLKRDRCSVSIRLSAAVIWHVAVMTAGQERIKRELLIRTCGTLILFSAVSHLATTKLVPRFLSSAGSRTCAGWPAGLARSDSGDSEGCGARQQHSTAAQPATRRTAKAPLRFHSRGEACHP